MYYIYICVYFNTYIYIYMNYLEHIYYMEHMEHNITSAGAADREFLCI